MTLTSTTCPYCGVGCGVLARADGTIKGDPAHPSNFGRLCSKDAPLGETIDLDSRFLHPEINGSRADWDSALDIVASRFIAAIRDHGPHSVAFYVLGQLLTEDYYVANKLMKGYIGSANIDTESRPYMVSSVAGHKRPFGSDTVPGIYTDFEEADLMCRPARTSHCATRSFISAALRPKRRARICASRQMGMSCFSTDCSLTSRITG